MAEMPICSTCKKAHWRFVDCAKAPALRAPDPYPIQSVPEGYKPWGHQLSTRDANGWLIPEKG